MTNKKYLEKMYCIYNEFTSEEKDYARIQLEHGAPQTVCGKILELLLAIENDIMSADAKKHGKGNVRAAFKRVLKNAEKLNALKNPIDVDGFLYACDGYRLVKIQKDFEIQGIDINEKNITKILSLCDFYDKEHLVGEMEIPDIVKLKRYIRIQKAKKTGAKREKKKPVLYCFGVSGDVQLPSVNAEYLVDMIEMFPEAKCFCGAGGKFIAFKDDSSMNSGYMMPIRTPDACGCLKTDLDAFE